VALAIQYFLHRTCTRALFTRRMQGKNVISAFDTIGAHSLSPPTLPRYDDSVFGELRELVIRKALRFRVKRWLRRVDHFFVFHRVVEGTKRSGDLISRTRCRVIRV
jgi:hypothetical protein